MFLIDTNVISESRKGGRADRGVKTFFAKAAADRIPAFLSVITIGELRRGVELIRHRGDTFQAQLLERWLESVLAGFTDNILAIDSEIAQLWGTLCAPHAENSLDKLIAATALIHGLTVVTRNTRHFVMAGVQVLDPFSAATRGGRPAP